MDKDDGFQFAAIIAACALAVFALSKCQRNELDRDIWKATQQAK